MNRRHFIALLSVAGVAASALPAEADVYADGFATLTSGLIIAWGERNGIVMMEIWARGFDTPLSVIGYSKDTEKTVPLLGMPPYIWDNKRNT